MNNLARAAASTTLAFVAGCSSMRPMRDATIGSDTGQAMTAEYRLVTQRPRLDPVFNDSNQQIGVKVTCTEPSPDVAVAFSTALSAAVTKGSASDNLNFQYAQTISELGKRYATVQMLNGMLFRDCEDYANGAIDEVAYSMRMGEFQSLVASMFAMEMVASVTPTPATPSSGANQNTTPDSNAETPSTTPPGGKQKGTVNRPVKKTANTPQNNSDDVTSALAAVGKATVDTQKADAAVKQLPAAIPAPADQAAINDLKAQIKNVDSALVQLKASWSALWAEIIKAGLKTDSTVTQSIKASNAAVSGLNVSATVQAAAKSKIGSITAAGKALDSAVASLKAAATAMASANPSTAPENPAGKPASNPSDAQAKAIQQIHRNFILHQSITPILVSCATEMNKVLASSSPIGPDDKIAFKADHYSAWVEFCSKAQLQTGAEIGETGELEFVQKQNASPLWNIIMNNAANIE